MGCERSCLGALQPLSRVDRSGSGEADCLKAGRWYLLHRMRRLENSGPRLNHWANAAAMACLTAILVTSCGGPQQQAGQQSATPTSPAAAHVWATGCGGTPIYAAPPPGWPSSASLPWIRSTPGGEMIGVWFMQDPYLVPAGHVHHDGAGNKILWIDQEPGELSIYGRPENSSMSPIQLPRLGWANRWPSSIDLPGTGCWTLTLRWESRQATVHVLVESP